MSFIGYWLFHNPVKDFEKSIPGMDDRPDSIFAAGEVVKIGEDFESFSFTSNNLQGKWSAFRGDNRENIVLSSVPLLSKFPENGPEILWSVELGEGHAAPAIYDGRAYLLDYIEEEKADALRCFDLVTGEEIWRRSYQVHIKRNHGMSRTVPAVNEQFVVTIGPKAQVMCCDRLTGDFIWGIDLVREYGAEIPFWYTGQCPLIDNNIAVLAGGGSSLVIGVDCITGEVLWKTPNPNNWKMSHASIIPMEINGQKMYIYAAVGGICGIAANGENVGEILWETKDFSPNVVAPSPLVLDDGNIFMTAGYGAGSIHFQIKEENGQFIAETLSMFKPKKGLASEQQTGIFYKDHVFTILPKDAGSHRNQFVCAHKDDLQHILWTSGKEERFGLGPYILADGKFYILKDDGTLVIASGTTERFEFLDKFKVLDGHDAWGPLAIADGKLIMRDSKTMVCLDIERK